MTLCKAVLFAPEEQVCLSVAMRFFVIFVFLLCGPLQAADREITAQGEFGTLAGSYRAAGDTVILMVPGSGPIDRNGQREAAIGIGVYEKFGNAFEAAGISSLRIDKRGSFASNDAIRTTDDLRIEGYARDLRAWINALRGNGHSCVWLMGHSEGGLVATVAAKNQADGICGIILIASPGRAIDLVLHDQLKAHTKSKRILRKIDTALAELKAGREIDHNKLPLVLKGLFNPVNQRFFIDWMRYEPAEVVASYKGPLLILQGTTDYQVNVADAQMLAGAAPHSTMKILEGVNHNMSYTDLIFPPSDIALSGDVIETILHFVGLN